MLGEPPRSLVASVWKAAVLVVIIGAGFALWRYTALGDLLDREVLLAQIEAMRQSRWAWPAMAGLMAVFSLIGAPITPVMLVNGVIFGFLGGWFASLTGTLVGGVIGFYLSRSLGRDLFLHLLRRSGLERVETTLENHGFWTLVRIRFLPIPFGIVNYAAGLTPMGLGRFVGASALTLVPVLAIYTFIADALMGVAAGDKTGLLWGAGAALLALFALSWLPGRKLRREVEAEPETEA